MIAGKSENQIIEAIKAGSESSLKILVNHYDKRLKYYVCSVYKLPEEDAEDIIQNAFIKFYKNINKYTFEHSFSTYIYFIVNNEAITAKRYYKKVFLSFDELFFHSKSNSVSIFENKDTFTFLLNRLIKKDRELIVLKDIQGFSYDEISVMLGIKVGTLKSKHSRAKCKLQEIIKKLHL